MSSVSLNNNNNNTTNTTNTTNTNTNPPEDKWEVIPSNRRRGNSGGGRGPSDYGRGSYGGRDNSGGGRVPSDYGRGSYGGRGNSGGGQELNDSKKSKTLMIVKRENEKKIPDHIRDWLKEKPIEELKLLLTEDLIETYSAAILLRVLTKQNNELLKFLLDFYPKIVDNFNKRQQFSALNRIVFSGEENVKVTSIIAIFNTFVNKFPVIVHPTYYTQDDITKRETFFGALFDQKNKMKTVYKMEIYEYLTEQFYNESSFKTTMKVLYNKLSEKNESELRDYMIFLMSRNLDKMSEHVLQLALEEDPIQGKKKISVFFSSLYSDISGNSELNRYFEIKQGNFISQIHKTLTKNILNNYSFRIDEAVLRAINGGMYSDMTDDHLKSNCYQVLFIIFGISYSKNILRKEILDEINYLIDNNFSARVVSSILLDSHDFDTANSVDASDQCFGSYIDVFPDSDSLKSYIDSPECNSANSTATDQCFGSYTDKLHIGYIKALLMFFELSGIKLDELDEFESLFIQKVLIPYKTLHMSKKVLIDNFLTSDKIDLSRYISSFVEKPRSSFFDELSKTHVVTKQSSLILEIPSFSELEIEEMEEPDENFLTSFNQFFKLDRNKQTVIDFFCRVLQVDITSSTLVFESREFNGLKALVDEEIDSIIKEQYPVKKYAYVIFWLCGETFSLEDLRLVKYILTYLSLNIPGYQDIMTEFKDRFREDKKVFESFFPSPQRIEKINSSFGIK